MFIKKNLLPILLIYSSLFSQEHFTGISTSKRGGLLNAYNNPAELNNNNLKIDISVFNTSFNYSNNKLTISDMLSGENFEKKFFSGSESANARIDALILGPGISYKKGNWTYALTSSASMKANLINVDVALGDAIQNGNLSNIIASNFINSNENQRINGTVWGEIDLSTATKIIEISRHKINAGLSLRLLFPSAYANFSATNLKGTINNTLGDLQLVNASANVNLSYSGTLANEYNELSNFSNFFSQGINGIATDIGFTYTFKKTDSDEYIINAGFAIKNIGSMNFKADQNTSIDYNLNVQGAQSLDLNQFENITSLTQLEQQLNQPQNAQFFSKTSTQKEYRIKLPTSINLYSDFKIYDKLHLTVSMLQKMVDDSENDIVTQQNTYTLIPRFNTKHFEVYAPQTINEISGFTSGIGFRLSGFYIGSSSGISALINNSKQADAYIGVRIGL